MVVDEKDLVPLFQTSTNAPTGAPVDQLPITGAVEGSVGFDSPKLYKVKSLGEVALRRAVSWLSLAEWWGVCNAREEKERNKQQMVRHPSTWRLAPDQRALVSCGRKRRRMQGPRVLSRGKHPCEFCGTEHPVAYRRRSL